MNLDKVDSLIPRSRVEIKDNLANASISVQNNIHEILEGMWIPDLTVVEWLNRKIPGLDVKHIERILIWWTLATLTDHML
jgi:hypothetical protein